MSTPSLRRGVSERNHFEPLKSFFSPTTIRRRMNNHLEKIFKGHLRNFGEPKTRSILRKAKPYIDPSFEGEAILSVGKTIDFAKRGASGVSTSCPSLVCLGRLSVPFLNGIKRKIITFPS